MFILLLFSSFHRSEISSSITFLGSTSAPVFQSGEKTVFQVSTSVSGEASTRYLIYNVNVLGENGPDRSTWGQISDQFDLDDCSSFALQLYPVPRKYFCIDHGSGVVKMTSHFQEPTDQKVYQIHVDVSNDGINKFRQVAFLLPSCNF